MNGTLRFILINLISLLLLWNFAVSDINGEDDSNIFRTRKYSYYMETKPKYTWSEAYAECKNRNMHLVTIDTADKANDVQIMLNEKFINQRKYVPWMFIGANDLAEFRKFLWVENNKPLNYTNWENGEPNNYQQRDERCVHIGFYGNEKWNDINCDWKNGFICERILGVEDLASTVELA